MAQTASQSRSAYFRGVASRWVDRSAPQAQSRSDFFRELARKMAEAASATADAQTGDETGIRLFRDLIMARPDDLRRRLLGANVMRRRELSAVQRRALDALGVWPDLLSPTSDLRYEPSHSRLIAYLMSPTRVEALGLELLNAFLTTAGCGIELRDPDELRRAQVTAERALPGVGRVDIEILTDSLLVYVECKIDAEEGEQQLAGYRSALKAAAGSRVPRLIYLTLPDAAPPSHAADAHLTFQQVLVAWLPFTGQARGPESFLERYLKSLALLLGAAGARAVDDWTYAEQRAALALVSMIEEGQNDTDN